MPLKNLPTKKPKALSDLVAKRPYQISSKMLSSDSDVSITLFSSTTDDGVMEESYPGDTMYYLVEGEAQVMMSSGASLLSEGDVMLVPAGTNHMVIGDGHDFKMLRITLQS